MTIPTFNVTSAFTIECWVLLNTNTRTVVGRSPRETGPVGWQAIIYKGHDNFFLAEAGGFITAGFALSAGNIVQVISSTPTTPGAFHHVAATYDGTALTLFLDGAQVARTAVTGAVGPSAEPVEVGGSASDGGYLGGSIDDVRIYERGLTASEIATDMATPVDVVREDVVSWDIDVFTKDAPASIGGTPIGTANFLRSAALCGLAPLAPPAGTVQNPTTARVTDPAATGKECEVAIENEILALPAAVGYTSTARARGATTVSDRSQASNPFDRVKQANPPNPSGPPVVK